MKLSETVQTIYIPKKELQGKHYVHFMGKVYAHSSWKPTYLRRPKDLPRKFNWNTNEGEWVEFKAVRTFRITSKKLK